MYTATDVLVFTLLLLSFLAGVLILTTGLFFSKTGRYPAAIGCGMAVAAIVTQTETWFLGVVFALAHAILFVCSLGGE